MAVISITYNDGNKKNLGYKSVNLSYENNKKKHSFKSGNFVKDWYDCIKFIITSDIKEPVMHSSSVDHYIMDGAKFKSAYLHTNNNNSELKYLSNSMNSIYSDHDISEEGIEFFVVEGTKPTWEELRVLCNDSKSVKKQK